MVNQHDWSRTNSQHIPPATIPPKKKEDEREQCIDTDMLGFMKFTSKEVWRKSETKHSYTWTGPRVPVDKWREVQAFFRMVNDTHKSEAVCRIYLNNTLGTWAFWAYPQEIKPGLEALELDGGEARQIQRAQFRVSEGWEEFGSIHSHCDAGAFQSGTDRKDESTNDGIHITLGWVSKAKMDMHWRISIMGQSYDIGNINNIWPELPGVESLSLPDDMVMKIIEHDACRAPEKEQTFPEQWKENLIPKYNTAVTITGTVGYHGGSSIQQYNPKSPSPGLNTSSPGQYYGGFNHGPKNKGGGSGGIDDWMPRREIKDSLRNILNTYGSDRENVMKIMDGYMDCLGRVTILSDIVDLASDNGLTTTDLAEAWDELMLEEKAEQNKFGHISDADMTGVDPNIEHGID